MKSTARFRGNLPVVWIFIWGLMLVGSSDVAAASAISYQPCAIAPPAPVREFRGAWIATVANIDWPSTNGLSAAQQKAELLALFDRASELRLNAIVFQVRPSCDALYASKLEPWSEYLTGTMGQPPTPAYDPLAFAVEQAHKRGLELHAWFNPFRARFSGAKSSIAKSHISRRHPQWVRSYGKQLWLDPGLKEVQNYSLSVVMDVVNRYDIDGVHFDDYFYPYKEKDAAGNVLAFPDETTWRRFGAAGRLTRDDWRRENINAFIARVYRSVKARKPWVKFGVSPFGIWRPQFPSQVRGMDAYADLYADSRKWLASGWVDYLAPQLYWSIDSPGQSFPALLTWWAQQNVMRRQLLAGLNSAKVYAPDQGKPSSAKVPADKWAPEEIIHQIRLARQQPGFVGQIHWHLGSLMRNGALDSALERLAYADRALIPAMPWLGRELLTKPRIAVSMVDPAGKSSIEWANDRKSKPNFWLVQTANSEKWRSQILPPSVTGLVWTGVLPQVVAISAVDRFGNLGPAAAVKLVRK